MTTPVSMLTYHLAVHHLLTTAVYSCCKRFTTVRSKELPVSRTIPAYICVLVFDLNMVGLNASGKFSNQRTRQLEYLNNSPKFTSKYFECLLQFLCSRMLSLLIFENSQKNINYKFLFRARRAVIWLTEVQRCMPVLQGAQIVRELFRVSECDEGSLFFNKELHPGATHRK